MPDDAVKSCDLCDFVLLAGDRLVHEAWCEQFRQLCRTVLKLEGLVDTLLERDEDVRRKVAGLDERIEKIEARLNRGSPFA